MHIPLCRKEQLAHASVINYQNTDKPVFFVLSFVAFVAQAKNSMKSISAIHPAITENTENTLVKRAPQRLIINEFNEFNERLHQVTNWFSAVPNKYESKLQKQGNKTHTHTLSTKQNYLATLHKKVKYTISYRLI